MKRWTNGLPGATQRLGAIMTQRGLTASQPWMRADTHRGPEHNRSTSEAEYIDAALTFALSQLHLASHGRAIQNGTTRPRYTTQRSIRSSRSASSKPPSWSASTSSAGRSSGRNPNVRLQYDVVPGVASNLDLLDGGKFGSIEAEVAGINGLERQGHAG